MMVRLPPGLDQRLAKAASDAMLPKAALARYLIRQQLDTWEGMTEQEELDHMRVSKESISKGKPNPNTARKKRKKRR